MFFLRGKSTNLMNCRSQQISWTSSLINMNEHGHSLDPSSHVVHVLDYFETEVEGRCLRSAQMPGVTVKNIPTH